MNPPIALLALVGIVVIVLAITEIMPVLAGRHSSLDRFDFHKSKRLERRERGGT